MAHIELQQVAKDFRVGNDTVVAVRSATLGIERGSFTAVVGHSGSGKTTLLSLIGGMAAPTSGRVLFDGADIGAWNSDRLAGYRCEKVGFMFQSASLLPVLTAKENLLLPAAFRAGRAGADDERRAEELLRAVGLADKVSAYPAQLSGGQQRRVAIARAFMNLPELVLADEPTGDLDEETEAEMMQFFIRMNREQRTTFVMVTHNTDLARQTDRQFRMDRGTVTPL
jgi:putative ABC transport system ATP-binding protein/lipoprotein-releasing system ATP-binding protein